MVDTGLRNRIHVATDHISSIMPAGGGFAGCFKAFAMLQMASYEFQSKIHRLVARVPDLVKPLVVCPKTPTEFFSGAVHARYLDLMTARRYLEPSLTEFFPNAIIPISTISSASTLTINLDFVLSHATPLIHYPQDDRAI